VKDLAERKGPNGQQCRTRKEKPQTLFFLRLLHGRPVGSTLSAKDFARVYPSTFSSLRLFSPLCGQGLLQKTSVEALPRAAFLRPDFCRLRLPSAVGLADFSLCAGVLQGESRR
jgi:hypothetical protein